MMTRTYQLLREHKTGWFTLDPWDMQDYMAGFPHIRIPVLPEDSEIIGVHYDTFKGGYVFTFVSSELTPVPQFCQPDTISLYEFDSTDNATYGKIQEFCSLFIKPREVRHDGYVVWPDRYEAWNQANDNDMKQLQEQRQRDFYHDDHDAPVYRVDVQSDESES